MNKVFAEISKVVVGDDQPSLLMSACMLAGGHVLIEDIPGVGKTLLASTMAKVCDVAFNRVQCTPDILPSDILGFTMFDVNTGNSKYIKGPVMTNLLLIDEINRTSPKTQSALLEVMEELKITVDGKVYKMPSPFMVIATQNPIENVGTSPLPEAQLDRFMMRISMGYPSKENELKMLSRFKSRLNMPVVDKVYTKDEIIAMQNEVSEIEVSESVMKYIIDIVEQTRKHNKVALGCSPRASLALLKASQAIAYICQKDFVIPDYVKMIAPFVLPHRLMLKNQLYGVSNAVAQKEIIEEIVANTLVQS